MFFFRGVGLGVNFRGNPEREKDWSTSEVVETAMSRGDDESLNYLPI